MPAKASLLNRSLRFWAFAAIGVALLCLLLAPSLIGGLVGGLWVSVMSAVISLFEAMFGR